MARYDRTCLANLNIERTLLSERYPTFYEQCLYEASEPSHFVRITKKSRLVRTTREQYFLRFTRIRRFVSVCPNIYDSIHDFSAFPDHVRRM